ncbi:MAG: hypothetical protein WB440_10085 [Steroidobacteraceae bacterium]|jgi:hypothetical protein
MNTQASAFKIFSILFGVIYTLSFYLNWNVFRYYPKISQFSLQALPAKTAGPPINWYAWIAIAAVASAVIAFLVPRTWAERLPPGLSWQIPALLVAAVLIYEKHWFF